MIMFKNRIFKKGLFEKGNNCLIADEVECGMIIALKNNKYFYVDDSDKEFLTDEIGDLYGDDDEVKPEHTIITFYNEEEDSISEVLGTEQVICFKRIDGIHNKN